LEGSYAQYTQESSKHLALQIQAARRLAPQGVIAVNVMVALSNYDEIIGVCVREGVDLIISGAGLPISLPGLTGQSRTKLVPVISSGRALQVIMRTWHRRYQRIPDAVIVEGPLCGGHMGFSYEQLAAPETVPITAILRDVRAVLAPFEAEYGRRVPIIGAESLITTDDILAMLALGFDGVQVGTRFICTEEAGIAHASKEMYVRANNSDVLLIDSPMGMPVRVLRNQLTDRLGRGEKIPFRCPFQCLRACHAASVRFCIADAMVHNFFGNTDQGIYLTGPAVGRVKEIIPAEEFFVPLRRMCGLDS
jgi:nitronate monooxygenase